MRTNYHQGTYLETTVWSTYVGGRVLCTDGKVRKLARISQYADTFFSVPAAVKVKGKTVSGYVTFETDENDEDTVVFRAYNYGKNRGMLP